MSIEKKCAYSGSSIIERVEDYFERVAESRVLLEFRATARTRIFDSRRTKPIPPDIAVAAEADV